MGNTETGLLTDLTRTTCSHADTSQIDLEQTLIIIMKGAAADYPCGAFWSASRSRTRGMARRVARLGPLICVKG
jgi:hypothetical protein